MPLTFHGGGIKITQFYKIDTNAEIAPVWSTIQFIINMYFCVSVLIMYVI